MGKTIITIEDDHVTNVEVIEEREPNLLEIIWDTLEDLSNIPLSGVSDDSDSGNNTSK